MRGQLFYFSSEIYIYFYIYIIDICEDFLFCDLVHESCEEEPDLHEHEVGGRVEDGEAVEGYVVVHSVEGGGNQVED